MLMRRTKGGMVVKAGPCGVPKRGLVESILNTGLNGVMADEETLKASVNPFYFSALRYHGGAAKLPAPCEHVCLPISHKFMV